MTRNREASIREALAIQPLPRPEPDDSPRRAFEHGVRASGTVGMSDNPYVVISCYDLADIWEEGRQLGIAIREGRI